MQQRPALVYPVAGFLFSGKFATIVLSATVIAMELREPKSGLLDPLQSLSQKSLGGPKDTFAILCVIASVICTLPPTTDILTSALHSHKLQLLAKMLIASICGLSIGYITYRAACEHRKKPILQGTAKVESSDPIVEPFSEPGLLLGYTTDDGTPLYLPDKLFMQHALIAGMTGQGKTVFGKFLMYQQIQRGGGLLFIDGKLDSDNIQDLYEFAAFCGRAQDFLVINPGQPEKSNTYNPILYGNADEIASRILSLIPDTTMSAGSDHYKQSANNALSAFIGGLKEAGLDYNFLSLVMLTMNEPALEELMRLIKNSAQDSNARKNLAMFLDHYSKDNISEHAADGLNIDLKKLKDTLGGIGQRMHQFGTGDFLKIINSFNPEVKLYDAIRDNKIVYVALPTMGKDVAAQNLGKMLVADLRTAISWLQLNKEDRPKIPFLAFMDEMSSYAAETLSVMFEQARSARVALMPAIQTDSGLSRISEDFKERVASNTAVKVFFKLASHDTATGASEMIDFTKRVARTETASASESTSGQALQIGPNKNAADSSGSSSGDREQEEYMVSTSQLKDLLEGECIVLVGQRVWNIRVPYIYLKPEIRESIGPLRINHVRSAKPIQQGKTTVNQNFDPMKKIDAYLEQNRARRITKRKEKKSSPVPDWSDDLPFEN